MVQPVTCTACSNDALQLICLHPDNFIYPFITVGYKEKNQNFNQVSQFKDDTIYSTEARNHRILWKKETLSTTYFPQKKTTVMVTYPQRFRHSLPNSMALERNKG